MIRLIFAACVFAAGCFSSDSRDWIEKGYEAGAANSSCREVRFTEQDWEATSRRTDSAPIGNEFSDWRGAVYGAIISCMSESDFLASHTWSECVVDGRALIVHGNDPEAAEHAYEVVEDGRHRIRGDFAGISCRKI